MELSVPVCPPGCQWTKQGEMHDQALPKVSQNLDPVQWNGSTEMGRESNASDANQALEQYKHQGYSLGLAKTRFVQTRCIGGQFRWLRI